MSLKKQRKKGKLLQRRLNMPARDQRIDTLGRRPKREQEDAGGEGGVRKT